MASHRIGKQGCHRYPSRVSALLHRCETDKAGSMAIARTADGTEPRERGAGAVGRRRLLWSGGRTSASTLMDTRSFYLMMCSRIRCSPAHRQGSFALALSPTWQAGLFPWMRPLRHRRTTRKGSLWTAAGLVATMEACPCPARPQPCLEDDRPGRNAAAAVNLPACQPARSLPEHASVPYDGGPAAAPFDGKGRTSQRLASSKFVSRRRPAQPGRAPAQTDGGKEGRKRHGKDLAARGLHRDCST